jgi:predicted HNH restriction endonuclease
MHGLFLLIQLRFQPLNALGMNITIEELRKILSEIKVTKDKRSVPDSARKRAFKLGWLDYTQRKKVYSEEVLTSRLTWQNLGNRLGQILESKTREDIEEIFEILAIIFSSGSQNHESAQHNKIENYDDELQAYEGKTRMRLAGHKYVERDRRFVREYKKKHKGIKTCVGCGMNPSKKFGIQAIDFFELHHLIPLATRKSTENSMTLESDVELLCPNCHRLIHKIMTIKDTELVTIDLLKNFIDTKGGV